MSNQKTNTITSSLLIAFFMVVVLWFVKWIELKFDIYFGDFGILPKSFSGIKGIFLSPFIHGDISHLLNNSIPIFVFDEKI